MISGTVRVVRIVREVIPEQVPDNVSVLALHLSLPADLIGYDFGCPV